MTYLVLPAVELLTATDEVELARRMEAGALAGEVIIGLRCCPSATPGELHHLARQGAAARERFLLANLRLVAMVSNRAARQSGLNDSDLFQEGVTGLIQAVDRFDYSQGVRFATYALPWIRSTVVRAVTNRCGTLNLTDARAERRRLIRTTWRRLTQQIGREASAAEVAAELGQSIDGVAELLDHQPPCALVDDGGIVHDLPDARAAAAMERVVEGRVPLAEWIDQLPVLERRVVELRFGFGRAAMSYGGIGQQLGLSPSTVRRVEHRALDRLRDSCSSEEMSLAG